MEVGSWKLIFRLPHQLDSKTAEVAVKRGIEEELSRVAIDRLEAKMNLRSSSDLELYRNSREAVQSVLVSTVCYDLMESSSKAVIFETSISFQLAFYALVEHDADVAPLWDPEKRVFVAMMTLSDFIRVLRHYQVNNLSLLDLASKSISDMLASPTPVFRHAEFQTVDAEDTVFQLCGQLQRLSADYVPVIDPDEGTLVSILGYLDLVHLLFEAAKQYPHFFTSTIQQLGVGTFQNVLTAPETTLLFDVLEVLEERNISGIPVTNEQGLVIGLYHKSDVSFISKSADPDAALSSLHTLQVGEAVRIQQSQMLEAASYLTNQTLCTCSLGDALHSVIETMMTAQVTRVVCVDSAGRCIGVVSIKDIVWHYFDFVG